jgi:GNAT superfamily N-acetyltransferase
MSAGPSLADPPRPSRRTLEAAARFGLLAGETPPGLVEPGRAAARAAWLVRAHLWSAPLVPVRAPARACVVLLAGPSGSGKSLTLSRIARSLPARAITWAADAGRQRGGSVVDQFPGPLDRALRLLAAAGLADARLFSRRVRDLSDGERARLSLALAMDRAERLGADGTGDTDGRAMPPFLAAEPPAVLIDELGSNLDDATAQSLARSLRRWADRAAPVRVIAATARDDLAAALRPDLLVRHRLGAHATVEHDPAPPIAGAAARDDPDRVAIGPGDRADYDALAPYHYRAGPPATFERILVARARARDRSPADPAAASPVGVLVVSRPTLNGPWRRAAWSARYASGRPGADARRLNREVRAISRVIVDPRYRGRGVATRLLRAYLDRPLTPRTEAVAAMAGSCPLFAAAGMRKVDSPASARDRRLRRALRRHGINPTDLADTDTLDALSRHPPDDLLRALRAWANAARATRGLARPRRGVRRAVFARRLLRAAAASLAAQRHVFVAG